MGRISLNTLNKIKVRLGINRKKKWNKKNSKLSIIIILNVLKID